MGIRKYELNDNYWDVIDTEDKAYFLGFMYADGCNVYGKTRIQISLQERDGYILEKFRECAECTGPINLVMATKKSHQNQYTFGISSRQWTDRLTKLGCWPRKTYYMEFPQSGQVPDHLLHHFVRGFFDGDGCLYAYKRKPHHRAQYELSFIAAEDFINGLEKLLLSKFEGPFGIKFRKNSYTLKKGGNKKIQVILDWMYKDATIFLTRKYEKYQGLVETNKNKKWAKRSNKPVYKIDWPSTQWIKDRLETQSKGSLSRELGICHSVLNKRLVAYPDYVHPKDRVSTQASNNAMRPGVTNS